MAIVFEKPKALTDAPLTTAPAAPMASSTAWWPRPLTNWACEGKAIGVAPVGCAVYGL